MISGSLEGLYAELDRLADVDQYIHPAAAEAQAEIRATAAAGRTPEGKPWALTKDGKRAMANAAAAVTARAAGSNLVIELSGPEVFHHYGVRGAEPRPVIPVDKIGEKLGAAIARGAAKPFKERRR